MDCNIDPHEAKRKRKARKLYLDKKRNRAPTGSFVPIDYYAFARYKRKVRKEYLQQKRNTAYDTPIVSQTPHGAIVTRVDTTGPEMQHLDVYATVKGSTHFVNENFNPNMPLRNNEQVARSHSTNVIVATTSANKVKRNKPNTNNTPKNTSYVNRVSILKESSMSQNRNMYTDPNVPVTQSSTNNVRIPFSNITNASPSPSILFQTHASYNTKKSLPLKHVGSSSSSTSISPMSSIRLTPGSHTLKRKSTNISSVPIFDLTSDQDLSDEDTNQNVMFGISKEYLDHGDQTVKCGICSAKLWKAESKRSKSRPDKSFSFCCGFGKVQLPDLKEAPPAYLQLFTYANKNSKYFIDNIRRYNSMFSFTSMGGKIDKSINKGKGPYTFRLSGQNYHKIGSLLPPTGSKPKFSQLYIYDTENEVTNRQQVFSNEKEDGSKSKDVATDLQLIKFLKLMLDQNNVLVKTYRMVRDCFHANPEAEVKLRLIEKRSKDGRTYNLPTTSEVAALIVGDISESPKDRDILVQTASGYLQRINELHPSYLALQYPLLFPYGDDGYSIHILHRGVSENSKSKRTTCTMREWFAFRLQVRDFGYSLIHNARRLFQQFVVDAYTMIESERLVFIRSHQKKLRCETYENLLKMRDKGKTSTSKIGQRCILPSSFTGGSRYMQQNYLDAMEICKWFGYPDLFITVTCNPKWPEITRFLKDTNLKSEDRPDILCRLFKIKLDALIKDLKDRAIFGKVQAVVYTIEFQKRGLPHSHICIFMHSEAKMRTIDAIEPFISAEIPKIEEDPDLFRLVKEFMIHGPCGAEHPKSPCMVDRRCSKNFPKFFSNHNSVDKEGFPIYRRRDDGSFVEKSSNVKLDNRYVVPYNKYLLKKYQAHINVEWCNQGGSIKYLFKYINKGPDRATLAVVRSNTEGEDEIVSDEIMKYYDCRYVSACEASWRIFKYDVHYRTPSVVRLPFHLPDKQNVVYGAEDFLDNVLEKPSIASSMFLSWMDCNKKYPTARHLTYAEFPTKFVWKSDLRTWKPRESGFSIGRIHLVDHKTGDAYYLRILLNMVKGPKSFEDMRTVNGIVYPNFRDACYARGLLEDDKEYINAIKEASISGSGYYLRSLFGTILLSGSFSRPEVVFESTWEYLADGILYNKRRTCPGISLNQNQLKNLTLFELESFLIRNNSSLKKFDHMPYPDEETVNSSNNPLIAEEMSYDNNVLRTEFESLSTSLTDEQRRVFDQIIAAVEAKQGGYFFVYGYGGTGKTFLWQTLSTAIRSKGEIVLNCASSGIASLLLSGGRTAHSRFHIPIQLNEDSYCFIQPNTDVSKLVKKASLIIWDEAPMIHKHAFEALDRTLRDVLSSSTNNLAELPFGGKVVVFGGDFRQILPVVTNGSRQDTVNASLSSSYLWDNCIVLQLTKNMRLSVGSVTSHLEETKLFAKWLLDIGEGKVGGRNDGEAVIEIPEDLLLGHSSDPIGSLIDFVYPEILQNTSNIDYFQSRAILAPKNEQVHEVNDRLLALFPGEEKVYLSADSLCEIETLHSSFDKNLYSPDVLNVHNFSGLPKHRLVLKVGVPVMLLRNIDQTNGLCNGTRLQIVALGIHVIEAVVITGSNIGYRTFLSRLSLIPSEKKCPFKFRRRQFPVSVCFAMTINKSQGQSLSRVGLFLKKPVFTHGQLYVALSRVKSRDGLKMLILDDAGNPTNKTCNVIYKEVFENLFHHF